MSLELCLGCSDVVLVDMGISKLDDELKRAMLKDILRPRSVERWYMIHESLFLPSGVEPCAHKTGTSYDTAEAPSLGSLFIPSIAPHVPIRRDARSPAGFQALKMIRRSVG